MPVLITGLAVIAPLAVVVFIVVKLFALFQRRRHFKHVFEDFPGPKPHWLYGNVDELRGNFDGLLRMSKYANLYKGAFPVWVGPFDAFLMSVHPSTAKTLLSGTDPKDEFSYELMKPWIGDGLLLSKGQKWARTRALLTQAFHADLIKRYIPTFCECTKVLLNKWRDKTEPIDVYADASLLTTDAMMRILFGYESNCQLQKQKYPFLQQVQEICRLVLERILSPVYQIDFVYYKTDNGKKFKALCEKIHEYSKDIIRRRRKLLGTEVAGSRSVDFLDILMTSKDSDGQTLSDQEIQDEVDTFLFEGHDSNASILSWTLWHLAKFPEYQDTCRKEVTEILGDREDITWEDLNKLKFTTMCIRENMRLLPPVSSISRTTEREFTLPDGRHVPKGITVGVSLFALHRNPDVWHEPDMYDPYRFSDEETSESDFFMPFSKGPRRCIGKSFGLQQAKLNIAMVIRNFRLSLVPDKPAHPESVLIIRSKNGVFLYLEPIK